MDPILELAAPAGHRGRRGRLPGPRRAATAAAAPARSATSAASASTRPRTSARWGDGGAVVTNDAELADAHAAAALPRREPALPPPHRRHDHPPRRPAGRDPARSSCATSTAGTSERRRRRRAARGPARRRASALPAAAPSTAATTSTTCSSSAARTATCCARTSRRAASRPPCTTRSRSIGPRPTPTWATRRAACPSPRRWPSEICSLPIFPGWTRIRIEAVADAWRSVSNAMRRRHGIRDRGLVDARAWPRSPAAAGPTPAPRRRGGRLRLLGPEPGAQRRSSGPRSRSPACARATPRGRPRSATSTRASRCTTTSTTLLGDPTDRRRHRGDAAAHAPRDRQRRAGGRQARARREAAGHHVALTRATSSTSPTTRGVTLMPGPHVPLQPGGQQGARPHPRGRARRGLLRDLLAHEPGQVPARRRDLRPRAARPVDPALPGSTSRSSRCRRRPAASSRPTSPRRRSSR